MIGAGAWSEVQLTAWTSVKDAEIVALPTVFRQNSLTNQAYLTRVRT